MPGKAHDVDRGMGIQGLGRVIAALLAVDLSASDLGLPVNGFSYAGRTIHGLPQLEPGRCGGRGRQLRGGPGVAAGEEPKRP